MNILKLIKERRAIRKYKNKPIPKKIIDKIIEAGIWGPSVPSFLPQSQSWKFVVIRNEKVKNGIVRILNRGSKNSGAGVNIMLSSAARIISNAFVVLVVYNSKELERKLKGRFKEIYSKFARIIKTAQSSAISATIQNMILVAESLGIGSCWLDTPLFCDKQINKLLGVKDEQLVAILTLGYPAEEGKRSERKPIEETVKWFK